MIDLKTNEKFSGYLLEEVAKMELDGSNELEVTLPSTKIKLFLIREESPLFNELNAIKGASLGVAFKSKKGNNFVVFRSKKANA